MGFRTFLLIVISIFFMYLDHKWVFFSKIRIVLNTVVSPIHYIVDFPITLFSNVGQNLSTHKSLIEENASLKAQTLLLQSQIQQLLASEKENDQLRALLGSTSKIGGKVLVARVLEVDSDPLVQQLIINRGSRDGVYVGQPVLDAQGVMGQIVEVDPLSSRIMLLDDARSGIPVSVVRNGLRAIAVGDGASNQLSLINMPPVADIAVGDVLVSSGLGSRYPTGYPVGIVTKVNHDVGDPYLSIAVKPSALLNRSTLVLLVGQENATPMPAANQVIEPAEQQNVPVQQAPIEDQPHG